MITKQDTEKCWDKEDAEWLIGPTQKMFDLLLAERDAYRSAAAHFYCQHPNHRGTNCTYAMEHIDKEAAAIMEKKK